MTVLFVCLFFFPSFCFIFFLYVLFYFFLFFFLSSFLSFSLYITRAQALSLSLSPSPPSPSPSLPLSLSIYIYISLSLSFLILFFYSFFLVPTPKTACKRFGWPKRCEGPNNFSRNLGNRPLEARQESDFPMPCGISLDFAELSGGRLNFYHCWC